MADGRNVSLKSDMEKNGNNRRFFRVFRKFSFFTPISLIILTGISTGRDEMLILRRPHSAFKSNQCSQLKNTTYLPRQETIITMIDERKLLLPSILFPSGVYLKINLSSCLHSSPFLLWNMQLNSFLAATVCRLFTSPNERLVSTYDSIYDIRKTKRSSYYYFPKILIVNKKNNIDCYGQ